MTDLIYKKGEDGAWETVDAGVSVRVATLDVSSAQLLTLFSDPLPVIAAPGPDEMIVVWIWAGTYTFGSVPYTLNLFPELLYESQATHAVINLDPPFDISAGASNSGYLIATGPGQNSPVTPPAEIAGQGIVFTAGGSDPTDGDGTVRMSVVYSIVPV